MGSLYRIRSSKSTQNIKLCLLRSILPQQYSVYFTVHFPTGTTSCVCRKMRRTQAKKLFIESLHFVCLSPNSTRIFEQTSKLSACRSGPARSTASGPLLAGRRPAGFCRAARRKKRKAPAGRICGCSCFPNAYCSFVCCCAGCCAAFSDWRVFLSSASAVVIDSSVRRIRSST